jgi:hypothetical protein
MRANPSNDGTGHQQIGAELVCLISYEGLYLHGSSDPKIVAKYEAILFVVFALNPV